MWTFLLSLLLAGAVSAAPLSPFFNYLPHYGNPGQGTNGVFPGMPSQPGINAPISMEIIFPQRFPNKAAGGAGGAQTFSSQGFIKYSLPKAPGRKSVEIIFPFEYIPQTAAQQPPMVPPFQDGAPQPHDPQQQPQQEHQAQTGQVQP
ncbi:secretory calcium-binding phosphoprotein 5 [Triplophysa dalaica]|uniref:secretory calcium-binding phosphoprotein 5 n=1 Tax=Triplophysa dalaica TaxID=1582913 RepID=UPI0024E027C1|nr:secretory calcium-binding phosphoprotein 5 [Triplophysa dalaica]